MVRKSLGAGIFVALSMSVPAFAQYMSTPPPPDRSAPAPAQPPGAVRSDSLTITAKNGQSDQQQWADRYECHKWAKDQSGFDPTLRPPSELSGEEINSRRDQYRRAFTACLEGRGYSVQYGHPASPAVAPAAAAAPVTASHWVRSTPELGYRPHRKARSRVATRPRWGMRTTSSTMARMLDLASPGSPLRRCLWGYASMAATARSAPETAFLASIRT